MQKIRKLLSCLMVVMVMLTCLNIPAGAVYQQAASDDYAKGMDGWSTSGTGITAQTAANESGGDLYLEVRDSVVFNKVLSAPTQGNAEVSFDFYVDMGKHTDGVSAQNNVYVIADSSGRTLAQLIYNNAALAGNQLYYNNGADTSQYTLLMQQKTWANLRFEFDLTAKTYNWYLNDVKVNESPCGFLASDAENVSKLIFTMNYYGNVFCVDNFQVTSDAGALSETFDDGVIDSGWYENVYSVPVTKSLKSHPQKALEITGDAAEQTNLTRAFATYLSGTAEVEYEVFAPVGSAWSVYFYGTSAPITVGVVNGEATFGDGSDTRTIAHPQGEWVRHKYVFDCTSGTYDVYLNGEEKATGLALPGSNIQIGNIVFYIGGGSKIYLKSLSAKDDGVQQFREDFSSITELNGWWVPNGVTTAFTADPTSTWILRAEHTASGAADYGFLRRDFSAQTTGGFQMGFGLNLQGITTASLQFGGTGWSDLLLTAGSVYASGKGGVLATYSEGTQLNFVIDVNLARSVYSISMNDAELFSEEEFGPTAVSALSIGLLGVGTLDIDHFYVNQLQEGSLSVGEIYFKDSEGNEVTTLTNGLSVKAEGTVYNNSFQAAEFQMITALYRGNKLVSLTTGRHQLEALSQKPVIGEPLVLSVETGHESEYRLQVFTWNNLNELRPLDRVFSTSPISREVVICPAPNLFGESGFYPRADYVSVFSDTSEWGEVYKRTDIVKFYINILNPEWGYDLNKLVAMTEGKEVAFEVGGAGMAPYTMYGEGGGAIAAAGEIALLNNWKAAGGKIDYLSTDHAVLLPTAWLGEGFSDELYYNQMKEQMRYFDCIRNWDSSIRFGMIESLGYFETDWEDKHYNHTASELPESLGSFEKFINMVTKAAREFDIELDHFDIDFGYDGVVYDGKKQNGGSVVSTDYGRILSVEKLLRAKGIKSGVIINTYDIAESSAEAAADWLAFWSEYQAAGGNPDKMVIQSWHKFPEKTGPETEENSFLNIAKKLLAKQ